MSNDVTVEDSTKIVETANAIDAEVIPELSKAEKMAGINISNHLNVFLSGLSSLNGQAAKRVLAALCMPGTDWELHKYTTEHEKNMFVLASKLMDSKIILMLSALEKANEGKQQVEEAAEANNTTETVQEVQSNG